ncbi:MAG: ABC transporter ATP-binding protein [Prevotella sp.]|nr:ABC transporter ATP-binding protein [Prevotella sp.]
MRTVLLKAEKLNKTFAHEGQQQQILKDIDLELYQGDFTVIMGASGAGKSTLLYALSGMDTPTAGTIKFGDKVITNLSQDGLAVFRRDHCGFVFQQIYLIDGMSVMDNVLTAGLLVLHDQKALVEKAKTLFAAVDIPEDTQKKFPTQISGGQAQRVGIVRALINEPEILFADEPTGALNSQTGLDVLDTLTKFNEAGQSVVMVTHDLRSARRGNRILYLKDGVILGECDLGQYRHGDKARHEKLAAFLQKMGW